MRRFHCFSNYRMVWYLCRTGGDREMTFEEKQKVLDFINACMTKGNQRMTEANKYFKMAAEVSHKLNEHGKPKIKLVIDNEKPKETTQG